MVRRAISLGAVLAVVLAATIQGANLVLGARIFAAFWSFEMPVRTHSETASRTSDRQDDGTLREPKLGLVRPGYLADLIIVDGNPAYNLKFMYSFGDLTLDKDGKMIRTNGIIHTIKDGVVTNNARLMEEVEKMVLKSKQGVPAANAVTTPFLGKDGKPIVPNPPE